MWDLQTALYSVPLHDPHAGVHISTRSTPDSAQVGRESEPGARKLSETVAARVCRKHVKQVGRFDRPPRRLLAAAGRARRQRLCLAVDEEDLPPESLSERRERARQTDQMAVRRRYDNHEEGSVSSARARAG